jgi:uncharacterized membrane protein YbaN (DUF454 family)
VGSEIVGELLCSFCRDALKTGVPAERQRIEASSRFWYQNKALDKAIKIVKMWFLWLLLFFCWMQVDIVLRLTQSPTAAYSIHELMFLQ